MVVTSTVTMVYKPNINQLTTGGAPPCKIQLARSRKPTYPKRPPCNEHLKTQAKQKCQSYIDTSAKQNLILSWICGAYYIYIYCIYEKYK